MNTYEQLQEYIDGPTKDCLDPIPLNHKARILLHHVEFISDWMIEDLDTEQNQDDRYRFGTWVEGVPVDDKFGHALLFERPTSLDPTSTYYSQAFRYYKIDRDYAPKVVEKSEMLIVQNDIPGPKNIDRTLEVLDDSQLIYSISIAAKLRKMIQQQIEPGIRMDFPVETAVYDDFRDSEAIWEELTKALESTPSPV